MKNTKVDADMIATADIIIEQNKTDYQRAKAKTHEPKSGMTHEQHIQEINKDRLNQIAPSAEMAAAIQEEKLEPKFIFQLIGAKDGKRSEPILNTWDGLTDLLIDMEHAMAQYNHDALEENSEHKDINYQDDYILLVAVINGEETIIPGTPLITVKHFLQLKAQ